MTNFPAPTGRLVLTLPMDGNPDTAVTVREQDGAFLTYTADGDFRGASKSETTAFSQAFALAGWAVKARPTT